MSKLYPCVCYSHSAPVELEDGGQVCENCGGVVEFPCEECGDVHFVRDVNLDNRICLWCQAVNDGPQY